MDNEELRTLQILEQIDNDEYVSQRALASNLNVSLGLMNSFIKRLVKKGYVKVTTIPKNRIAYLLTPKGVSEKTALTYEYIKYTFTFYKNIRRRLLNLFGDLYSDGVRTVAFWGVSELTEIAFLTIQQTQLKFVGFYSLKKDIIVGKETKCIENIENECFDKIIVTEIDYKNESRHILEKSVNKKKIIKIE